MLTDLRPIVPKLLRSWMSGVIALVFVMPAASGESDKACDSARVVQSRRLASTPWTELQRPVADAAFGNQASALRVKIYETLTQDASWRFHNNVLPQLIKSYGASVAFDIHLHPSADFRNVLASQLVNCAGPTDRLKVMDVLFKAMADGKLDHDDSQSAEACAVHYDRLYAVTQGVFPISRARFQGCLESQAGLVHQDAVAKMSYDDGVRRNPAVFVNGQVAYDYDIGAISRRIDAAR
jgi:hypothetical protein